MNADNYIKWLTWLDGLSNAQILLGVVLFYIIYLFIISEIDMAIQKRRNRKIIQNEQRQRNNTHS